MGDLFGGGDQEVTQKSEPWGVIQPNLKEAYQGAASLYRAGGPQYYPGQTYVPQDPLSQYAQNLNLAYAQQALPGQVGAMQTAQQQMLNAPDVASNPYIGGIADVIQNRLGRQFQEQMMPRIESGAIAAGQFGGSRQGISEGLAARGTQEATGDALANLYGQAYGQGLDQQARGMQLAPTTMQAGMLPMQVMGQVGDYRRGMSEQALQDDMQRWSALQQQPYANVDWYLKGLLGAPGGTTTQTQPGANPLANILGTGLTVAGLFGGIPGLGSAASSIGSWGGLGSLSGGFGTSAVAPAALAGGINPFF